MTCLTATPCGATAQMLASPTSKQGQDREAPAALLRVRTGPECPEGNLRELTKRQQPRLWDSYPAKSPKTPSGLFTEQRTEQS